ncbi:hypothetical protein DAI22_06g070450 [Oryza sativa Japonica Group]|nr:hypothetical protein DAI22_06g070450 [Oryza sativa Japonica Group]
MARRRRRRTGDELVGWPRRARGSGSARARRGGGRAPGHHLRGGREDEAAPPSRRPSARVEDLAGSPRAGRSSPAVRARGGSRRPSSREEDLVGRPRTGQELAGRPRRKPLGMSPSVGLYCSMRTERLRHGDDGGIARSCAWRTPAPRRAHVRRTPLACLLFARVLRRFRGL